MLKNLKLEKNPDILEYLGKTNKNRPKIVVGFSAETQNIDKNSEEKLRNKNCDMIISNDVSRKFLDLIVILIKFQLLTRMEKKA